MATRHQRRKAMRARKNAKAEILERRALRVLQEERERLSLSDPRKPARSPRGLQSRWPNLMGCSAGLKGFGTGAFKPDPISMTDGQERVWKARIKSRVDKP